MPSEQSESLWRRNPILTVRYWRWSSIFGSIRLGPRYGWHLNIALHRPRERG